MPDNWFQQYMRSKSPLSLGEPFKKSRSQTGFPWLQAEYNADQKNKKPGLFPPAPWAGPPAPPSPGSNIEPSPGSNWEQGRVMGGKLGVKPFASTQGQGPSLMEIINGIGTVGTAVFGPVAGVIAGGINLLGDLFGSDSEGGTVNPGTGIAGALPGIGSIIASYLLGNDNEAFDISKAASTSAGIYNQNMGPALDTAKKDVGNVDWLKYASESAIRGNDATRTVVNKQLATRAGQGSSGTSDWRATDESNKMFVGAGTRFEEEEGKRAALLAQLNAANLTGLSNNLSNAMSQTQAYSLNTRGPMKASFYSNLFNELGQLPASFPRSFGWMGRSKGPATKIT